MHYDAAAINRFDLTRYPDYRGDFPPDVVRGPRPLAQASQVLPPALLEQDRSRRARAQSRGVRDTAALARSRRPLDRVRPSDGRVRPMRKLFMCAEVKVVSGGAVISR